MNTNKQRIVFMGTPQFAADILAGLFADGYNIVAVVSQPDKEFGRKKVLKPSQVKMKALELGRSVCCAIRYEGCFNTDPNPAPPLRGGECLRSPFRPGWR